MSRTLSFKYHELYYLFGRRTWRRDDVLQNNIFRTASSKCHEPYYLNVTNSIIFWLWTRQRADALGNPHIPNLSIEMLRTLSFIWQGTRRRANVLGIHIFRTLWIKCHKMYLLHVTNSIIYLAGGLDDAQMYFQSTYSELYRLNVTNFIV